MPGITFQGYSGELVGNGGFSKKVECQRGPVCVFYDSTTSTGLPCLVGFIGGMVGDQWMDVPQVYTVARQKQYSCASEGKTPFFSQDELKSVIVQQVVDCFGKEGSDPEEVIVYDWRKEPFIFGGPCSIMPPGRSVLPIQVFFLLSRPPEKTRGSSFNNGSMAIGKA